MVYRGYPLISWYAVEGFSEGGASAMPRHVAKEDKNVPHPLVFFHFLVIVFVTSCLSSLFFFACPSLEAAYVLFQVYSPLDGRNFVLGSLQI